MTICKKTCIFSALAVFIFLAAYNFVVHGILLKSLYMETAPLWRPVEEIHALMPWSWVQYAVLALVFTCLFKKCRTKAGECGTKPDVATTSCPIQSGGVCFGMKIGLLMAVNCAACYIYMPIPGTLAAAWFAASLFEGIGAGILLGVICRAKKCDAP
jgi:hypothetical protein